MARLIKSHNSKLLGKDDTSTASKCTKKDLCPLNSACLVDNIIYKATVTTTLSKTRVYIGMAEHSLKTRFNNHKVSFKHRKHSCDTVLSKFIWDLKDSNTDFSIKWSIVTRASSYKEEPVTLQFMADEKSIHFIR